MPLVADYQYPLVQYSIECVRARELLGVVRADRHGTRVEDVDARGPPAMAGAVTPGAAPPSNRVSSILGSVFPVPNAVDERGGVSLGGRGPRPGLLDPGHQMLAGANRIRVLHHVTTRLHESSSIPPLCQGTMANHVRAVN